MTPPFEHVSSQLQYRFLTDCSFTQHATLQIMPLDY